MSRRHPLWFSEQGTQGKTHTRVATAHRRWVVGSVTDSRGEEALPSAPDVGTADTLSSSRSFVDIVNARIEARLGVNLETVVTVPCPPRMHGEGWQARVSAPGVACTG